MCFLALINTLVLINAICQTRNTACPPKAGLATKNLCGDTRSVNALLANETWGSIFHRIDF
jgi:hypothetical protein